MSVSVSCVQLSTAWLLQILGVRMIDVKQALASTLSHLFFSLNLSSSSGTVDFVVTTTSSHTLSLHTPVIRTGHTDWAIVEAR